MAQSTESLHCSQRTAQRLTSEAFEHDDELFNKEYITQMNMKQRLTFRLLVVFDRGNIFLQHFDDCA